MTQQPGHNPFAPPTSHVEDVKFVEGPTELASRGSRLAAAVIDGLLGGALYFLITRITPLGTHFDQMAVHGFFKFLLFSSLFGFFLFVVLHGYLLDKNGQTIGKMLMGIRITRPDGSKASLARLLGLRYCVSMLPWMVPVIGPVYGLVNVMLIFRESRRCLHDNIADTIVIKVFRLDDKAG